MSSTTPSEPSEPESLLQRKWGPCIFFPAKKESTLSCPMQLHHVTTYRICFHSQVHVADTVSEGHSDGEAVTTPEEYPIMSQVLHVIFGGDGFYYCLTCPERIGTATKSTQFGGQWHHLSQFDPFSKVDTLKPSSPVQYPMSSFRKLPGRGDMARGKARDKAYGKPYSVSVSNPPPPALKSSARRYQLGHTRYLALLGIKKTC